MTPSLHIAAQPARAASSDDKGPVDAQQGEHEDLFSKALSMLQQPLDHNADAKSDDAPNEKPSDDATTSLPGNILAGMAQPILQVILSTPAASVVAMQSTQLEQPASTPESKTNTRLHGAGDVPVSMVSSPDVTAAKMGTDLLLAGLGSTSHEQGAASDVTADSTIVYDAIKYDAIKSLRATGVDPTVGDHMSQPIPPPKTAVSTDDTLEVSKDLISVRSSIPGAATATLATDISVPVSQPSVVKLAAEPAQSRPQLLDALGERIRLQVERHSEQATIRLDPPMMGRIEIMVRHEAGTLQVQLNASNAEVVRQLQAISDHLCQDLVQRQYTDVSVSVSGQPRDDRQQHQQKYPEDERGIPGRALADQEQDNAAFVLASNID